MAYINLRWVCAPLLFVSSVALSQGAPDLPPVFTQYVVPYDDLISTPRGDGACVAGYVEAICNTGGTNQCFSYKEDDGNYYMRVRSTGYYCGSWADYNNPQISHPDYDYENIKPEPIPSSPDTWDLDDLAAICGDIYRGNIYYRDRYNNVNEAAVMDFSANCYYRQLIEHENLSNLDIHNLQILVSNTRDFIRGLNDYMNESLNNKSDRYIVDFLNFRLNALESDFNSFMTVIADRQDDLEELYTAAKSNLDNFSALALDAYRLANSALPRDEFYSYMNENNDMIFKDISDLRDETYSAIGGVYEFAGNEFGNIYEHVGLEIASLTADIEANNDGIASSIDSQTGEIVGAIDDQSSIIAGQFGDLTDFLSDGEPTSGDLANQDSQLSGLVSDYDYFVDYNIDIGEAVCPAPYQLDLAITGKTVYVSFEPMCEASVLVKPLLIAASSVAFALIVMGVRRA